MIKDDGHVASRRSPALGGQSNIAKSFLINSLRVSREVCAPTYVSRYALHTQGASGLCTRFPGEIVEVRSGRKDSEGRGIKWHTRPRRYRENSPFVTGGRDV